ncbi:transposase [Streptomyces angustmyceticus]|nr:transposase [Streptomyces angustmyceticus]
MRCSDAVGARWCWRCEGLGRSRGRFTSKVHLSANGHCGPLSLIVTPGQRADCTKFKPSWTRSVSRSPDPGRPRKKPDSLAADKAYSNGPIHEHLRRRGIRHAIPETVKSPRVPGLRSPMSLACASHHWSTQPRPCADPPGNRPRRSRHGRRPDQALNQHPPRSYRTAIAGPGTSLASSSIPAAFNTGAYCAYWAHRESSGTRSH